MSSTILKVLSTYGALPENALHRDVLPQKLRVLCKFHDDHTPDMEVNLVTGRWRCYACDVEGSTIIEYIERLETLLSPSPPSQLHAFAVYAQIARLPDPTEGVEIERTVSHVTATDARNYAEDFYTSLPYPIWEELPVHYLRKTRGYSMETLSTFDVRLNPASTHPIIIPIYQQGMFRGYVMRRIDAGEPKYLYNSGFSKSTTVGGNIVRGQVLVVEGLLDLMKAWQYGWKNVCCLFGWHCSIHQFKHIAKYATSVICGLDNDEHGEQGYSALQQLFTEIPVTRLPFPTHTKDVGAMTEASFTTAMLYVNPTHFVTA